ncbi:helix-turn-helix domain-containing protein [Marinifilum caeruleilacunae]|uniref:AraC family transcriptional regulator n=1 Tax=Marinifilum caeruleilacunae TaxID=2499076 RepID=A0ABX1WXY4_9BACT|nr:AraC family transcriptional regulator [Marinifilum caeruleilacunae]NOU60971.1 AraC family transcriptional regulator [Marinifilum caeruleilacunae]
MSASSIFLILISGLGVLHGIFLASFLQIHEKYKNTSNKFLALLLLVLSFRVGKSVFLNFAETLELWFIFIGLAAIMLIGPLFYFYAKSLSQAKFKLKPIHYLHFIPTLGGIAFSIWVNTQSIFSISKVILGLAFLSYYLHFLTYLIVCFLYIRKERKNNLDDNSYALLQLLFYSLLAVWMVYVLNLFDSIIPYIIGPILYTILAYAISLIVVQKGYLKKVKYKTTSISNELSDEVWSNVKKLVVDEKLFKNGDLTLKSLSQQLNVTPQSLSMIINQKNKTNFNSFINQFRIEEAIRLFKDQNYKNFTIASISYEAGFNSVSSFNTAFKNFTKSTPFAYRKSLAD